MARVVRQSKQQTEPEPPASGNRLQWILGMVFMLIACVASGVLALKQLGWLGESLPGCGPQSGCGAVTNSVWGKIPGIMWPVSYVGFAYFVGMLVAWGTNAMQGTPNTLRWIARLSALCSFSFMVVMVVMDSFCVYCITAHVANFAFWIVVERSTKQTKDTSFNAFMSMAFSFMIITAVAAIGQFQQQSVAAIEGAKVEQEQVQQMAQAALDARNGATPAKNDATSDTSASTAEEALEETTIVGADFTGRYLLGSPDAPVKVVMISDYQCPDCYRYEEQMMDIISQRSDVSLSVKHFPFDTECNPNVPSTKHPVACIAAYATEAAGILGGNDAFWGVHKWMFAQKGTIRESDLFAKVAEFGIDPIQFSQLMRSEGVKSLVLEDVQEAVDLGIYFTPMIFVNGVELKWYAIPSSLSSTISLIASAIESGADDGVIKQPPSATQKYVLDWQDGRRVPISDVDHAPAYGADDPAVDVVVWVEYGSDFMAKVEKKLQPLLADNPDLRVTYRVYPVSNECNARVSAKITSFPAACITARAAKAAYMAGGAEAANRFHEWLLESGTSITGESDLMTGAIAVGIDPAAFQDAMDDPRSEALVAEDVRLGAQGRFRGPPAIFVNERHVPRYQLEGHDILGEVVKRARLGD
jgi:protein-disulfide isomerase/uncharacterized membrane protein